VEKRIRSLSNEASSLHADRNVHCYLLVKKFQRDGKIQCRICKSKFNITIRQQLFCRPARSHAYSHLGAQCLYRCKLCSKQSNEVSGIKRHLKLVHGDGVGVGQFENLSDDFHAQIMDVFTKCYDWDGEGVEETVDTAMEEDRR